MDKFVYSVTHDLRAPLMSLLGLIKISKVESGEIEISKYLEMMETSVFKLDDFIKDIIDFSRNARTVVEKKEINFDSFVHEVWQNHQYISDSEKISFEYINELDRPFKGDEKRMSIILSNLLSNAIRYQNYSRDNAKIQVKIERDDECLKMTVQDNGPGIPEQYQEKIFDMFFRANDTKNGSGLGLYIVKETVEKLDGVIRLKSSSISGSSFQVFIPF
ncbi:MAG: HAMP domain-containing sensor histidine kinase [Cytophagales bacterium]